PATSARLPTAANYPWPLSLVRYSDRQIRRSANIAPESFWRRMQHRRIVTAGGWRVSDIGWVLAAAYVSLQLWERTAGSFAPWSDIVLISFPDLVSMAVLAGPSILAGFIWPRRWLTIEYELSLPASRAQHVRETIVAMFIDYM